MSLVLFDLDGTLTDRILALARRLDASEVYRTCMSRTNIDIDDDACRSVMNRYGFATKREAVNFALRMLVIEPLSLEAAHAMEGSGWEGDLDEMRTGRVL